MLIVMEISNLYWRCYTTGCREEHFWT